MPYVKEGGYFVSYKSGKAAEEVSEAKKAISVLGGKLEKEVDFKLYKTDMDRTLVVIKKVKGTQRSIQEKQELRQKSQLYRK